MTSRSQLHIHVAWASGSMRATQASIAPGGLQLSLISDSRRLPTRGNSNRTPASIIFVQLPASRGGRLELRHRCRNQRLAAPRCQRIFFFDNVIEEHQVPVVTTQFHRRTVKIAFHSMRRSAFEIAFVLLVALSRV